MSQVCRRMKLDLIPLWPGDLEPAEAELVREHVTSCAACAAELAVFAAQGARLASAREGRVAPKLDLWENVRAELRNPAPRGIVISFQRVAVAAAAAAALLVGSFLAWQHLGTTNTITPAPHESIAKDTKPSTEKSPPVLVQNDTPAPRPTANVEGGGRHHRDALPPIRFFQDEGAIPLRFAEDRELVPLDEEAQIPARPSRGARRSAPREDRAFEAEPAPRKTKKSPPSEDGSLSF